MSTLFLLQHEFSAKNCCACNLKLDKAFVTKAMCILRTADKKYFKLFKTLPKTNREIYDNLSDHIVIMCARTRRNQLIFLCVFFFWLKKTQKTYAMLRIPQQKYYSNKKQVPLLTEEHTNYAICQSIWCALWIWTWTRTSNIAPDNEYSNRWRCNNWLNTLSYHLNSVWIMKRAHLKTTNII